MIDRPFPNADRDFNLKAMGMSFIGVDMALKRVSNERYEYLVSNGQTMYSENEAKRLKESGNIYTTNDKQVELVKVLEIACKSLNDANILGNPIGFGGMIRKLFKNCLKIVDGKVEMNPDGILHIR